MINTFRQFIVPWLLALLLAWLLVSLWLHNEIRSQQQQQIQQLAVTINYAVQARPPVNGNEQLSNQLRQIHNSSALAVQQIVVYNAEQQLIASSAATAEAPILTAAPDTYQLSTMDNGSKLALIPISAGLSTEQQPITGQLSDNGYLAVVYQTDFSALVWLIPLALLSAAIALGMAISFGAVKRGQMQLNTDIELMAHHLRRLAAAQQGCQLSEQLVQPLQPLQLAFNELAVSFDQRALANEQLIQQLNQRLQQLNSQSNEFSQQRQQLIAEQQQSQRQIRHWFEQCQLLWQRKNQLQPLQLQRLVQMHLLAGHYQFSLAEINDEPIELSRWLGQHIDELNALLPGESVRVDWQEHPDNLAYLIKTSVQTLKSLIEALLMLALRAEDVSKITVTLQVQVIEDRAELVLAASCNGNGLPAHCRQLIRAADMLELQWSDADIALLNAIRATGATFNSQSLDGLGCILQLSLPLQVEPVTTEKALQQLLIFDADEERLQRRSAALAAVAAQVTGCSKVSELEQLMQQTAYQLILLFPPLSTSSTEWQRLYDVARQQKNLLCFVPPRQLSTWQDALPESLADHQFCLWQLMAYADNMTKDTRIQQILVVDDNETNLAFVQVLLKNKPLILHTATSAQQVFALCQQQKFDMILLDIQLPDMSGVDVAKQLRQLPQYQQVPIVAFTAHAMPAEIDSYRQAGMNDIIFKPLEPAKLDSLLEKFSLMALPGTP